MFNKRSKFSSLIVAILLMVISFNWAVITTPEKVTASAASNLISNGDFEGNIENDWILWTNGNQNYQIQRSYGTPNAPVGLGSYSASITNNTDTNGHWDAGLSSKKGFTLETGTDYYLVFYTKSQGSSFNISVYLDDQNTAITDVVEVNVNNAWEKHTLLLSPAKTGTSYLSFALGEISRNSSLIIDGIGLYKADFEMSTTETKGYIGDNAKLKVSNIDMFEASDIEIELPYFDPKTKTESTTRINPTKIDRNYLYFVYPSGTYAGVGKLLVNGSEIGSFSYDVSLKISAIYPEIVRADENMTIVGTGFHPGIHTKNVYVIMKAIGADGKAYEYWTEPTYIDSRLTQITVTIPNGIVSSKLYVQSASTNKDNELIVKKSNSISYKIKPVVYNTTWNQAGYNQVGDDLLVSGKGLGSSPRVIFYDLDGNQVDSKKGKLVEISDTEYIKVPSTTKTNEYRITVVADRIESENAEMIPHSASPKLESLRTKNYRRVGSNDKVYAAKIGEVITIKGISLRSENTYIEFAGPESSRIRVRATLENISENGTSLSVEVPVGAMNGQIAAVVNGKISNYLPLEIIPMIIDHTPTQIGAGTGLSISATGAGTDTKLASVEFITDGRKETVTPKNIWYENGATYIYLITPKTISNNTTINISYGHWSSANNTVVTANPVIKSAGLNKDTKVLTIKGYGFSLSTKENEITYMYADENKTVIAPKVKILGVYSTAEGQEIKVQIYDDYHYGYVTVAIDGQISNEAQFGPVNISRIARRAEYVEANGRVMGVLYISGSNLGERGGVRVGDVWANVHYRNNSFIIAVVEETDLYNDPVIVAREQ